MSEPQHLLRGLPYSQFVALDQAPPVVASLSIDRLEADPEYEALFTVPPGAARVGLLAGPDAKDPPYLDVETQDLSIHLACSSLECILEFDPRWLAQREWTEIVSSAGLGGVGICLLPVPPGRLNRAYTECAAALFRAWLHEPVFSGPCYPFQPLVTGFACEAFGTPLPPAAADAASQKETDPYFAALFGGLPPKDVSRFKDAMRKVVYDVYGGKDGFADYAVSVVLQARAHLQRMVADGEILLAS